MFETTMTDKQIEKRYVEADVIFANEVMCLYLGECDDFRNILGKWQKLELEYARRWLANASYKSVFTDSCVYSHYTL